MMAKQVRQHDPWGHQINREGGFVAGAVFQDDPTNADTGLNEACVTRVRDDIVRPHARTNRTHGTIEVPEVTERDVKDPKTSPRHLRGDTLFENARRA